MMALSHAVVVLALTLDAPVNGLAVQPYPSSTLRQVSLRQLAGDVRWDRPEVTNDTVIRAATRASLVTKRHRFHRWLPCVGAAVGGTVMGIAVANEEDFASSGRLMWVSIGAAAGASVGWVIARIAGR